MALTNTETLLAVLLVAAISAIIGSGLTVGALILFFKNLLASPAALQLVAGLIDSFPPATHELIHVMAQFLEKVSADGLSAGTSQATPPAEPGHSA